jgi:hypothetical protein
MAWYLFYNPNTGDLVSSGSALPEHLAVCLEPTPNPACLFHVRDVGESPDWAVKLWDRLTRTLVDQPVPILIDRLDDIQTRLLADPDFVARWNALNVNQRNQLRTGIMRVLAALVGSRRFRQEDERVELD